MVNEPLMCCEENCVHCEAVKQVGCRMPDEQTARLTSNFFKAFADKTRVRILSALAIHELCVCDIADLLGHDPVGHFASAQLSQQVRLVVGRKEGKTVYYTLCDGHIRTILRQGIEHVQEETKGDV